jgi:putative MATE family efflux protein
LNLNKFVTYKKIIILALPIMLSTIFQTLQGTVDMAFVSWLGTESAAAVILGNSLFFTVFTLNIFVSAGAMALLARSYGQGDHEAIQKSTGEILIVTLILSGFLSICLTPYTKEILSLLFNSSAKTTALSASYTKIVLAALPIPFFNVAFQTILRAHGDTKTGLYVTGTANVINMVLDPIFIFTLGLGIPGAAYATVLSRALAMVVLGYYVIKTVYDSHLAQFFSHLTLTRDHFMRMFRIGGWASIQAIARPITGMLMFRLVTMVGGNDGTAAFGIGGQLFNYTFVALSGLSVAMSILTGHKLGEGKAEDLDHIIKAGVHMAYFNMILFILPYMVFPAPIFSLFKSTAEVTAIGIDYLRIVYCGVFFVVYPMIYGGVLQGAGDTRPAMVGSLIANVVFKLIFAYLLAFKLGLGLNGIWLAIALSVVIEAFYIMGAFRKNTWRTKEV